MAKLFVIFGITGQQGGSLLTYMLNHPEFSRFYHFRAITRDVSKPTAEKLREKVVEVRHGALSINVYFNWSIGRYGQTRNS